MPKDTDWRENSYRPGHFVSAAILFLRINTPATARKTAEIVVFENWRSSQPGFRVAAWQMPIRALWTGVI